MCCVSPASPVKLPSLPPSKGTAGNAGLPDAEPGAEGAFGCGAKDAATHLRNIFYRSAGGIAGREVESVDDENVRDVKTNHVLEKEIEKVQSHHFF